MQIVIDIDEDLYDTIKNLEVFITTQRSGKRIINGSINAIKNGIRLPKGHEKLIAEPTEEEIEKTIGGKNDFADCIREAVKAVFDNASAVIEADKAESEVRVDTDK